MATVYVEFENLVWFHQFEVARIRVGPCCDNVAVADPPSRVAEVDSFVRADESEMRHGAYPCLRS